MATVKKIKKAQSGDVTCPGGKCRPARSSSSTGVKTEGYKPGKPVRWTKKEEAAAEASARAKQPYERDFPGDSAPAGFGGDSEGKKSTRWRTIDKKGIRYVGQATKGKSGVKVPKKAKSGASFDLNKDGKTTFKDVLIGRGVLPKTAKKGASVKKAKMGCMSCGGKMKKK